MDFPDKEYPHQALTKQIIGAAMTVHRELKGGLNEKIYENALCIELEHQNIPFSQQTEFPVHYRGNEVGKLIPDLLVSNNVIVEAKSVDGLNGAHYSQILSYLAITGLEVGILINFKNQSLEFKRVSKLNNYPKQ